MIEKYSEGIILANVQILGVSQVFYGFTRAMKEETFSVLESRDMVMLRVYGEHMILKEFDRNKTNGIWNTSCFDLSNENNQHPRRKNWTTSI